MLTGEGGGGGGGGGGKKPRERWMGERKTHLRSRLSTHIGATWRWSRRRVFFSLMGNLESPTDLFSSACAKLESDKNR